MARTKSKKCVACKEILSHSSYYVTRKSNGVEYPYSTCKDCNGIWHRYRLNKNDLTRLLEIQEYKCGICSNPIERGTLHIDHCHDKGHIRGLLCLSCNIGIGLFKHDPVFLTKAVYYVHNNKHTNVITNTEEFKEAERRGVPG